MHRHNIIVDVDGIVEGQTVTYGSDRYRNRYGKLRLCCDHIGMYNNDSRFLAATIETICIHGVFHAVVCHNA